MTNCTSQTIVFPACRRRLVAADFDGGDVTSNGGVLLLREADRRSGRRSARRRRAGRLRRRTVARCAAPSPKPTRLGLRRHHGPRRGPIRLGWAPAPYAFRAHSASRTLDPQVVRPRGHHAAVRPEASGSHAVERPWVDGNGPTHLCARMYILGAVNRIRRSCVPGSRSSKRQLNGVAPVSWTVRRFGERGVADGSFRGR